MMKALNKVRIEGIFSSIRKAIYHKAVASIVLNRENLKSFPIKSGMRLEYPLSPLLFNIVLESSARGIRQDKEIKGIKIKRKKSYYPYL
jgi:hypothetical protein